MNDHIIHNARQRFTMMTWIRALVSVGLICWIVFRLNWTEVVEIAADINTFYLGVSILLTPVMMMTGVMKWQILLRACGIRVTTSTSFAVYLIGMFFNNFLPTNFGGDAVRAYLMGRASGRFAVVAASVFMERLLGLTIFIVMVPIALLLSLAGLWSAPVYIGVGAVVAGYLGVLWVILDSRFHRALAKGERIGIIRKVMRFQQAVAAYRGHGGAIASCLALSVLFYGLAVCNVFVSLLAFNVELSVVSVFIATAVVLVVSMLPIAINGMGLAEWAYIVALGQFGVSPAEAVAAALLIRLKTLAWSLLGGGVYGSGYQAKVAEGQMSAAVAETGGGVCD